MNTTLWLLLIALLVNGLLAGASMDQSIKQLPARHRIGVVAYSEYSKAADLGNGLIFYPVLGIGAALIALVAAVVGILNQPSGQAMIALWVVIALTLAHSAATSRAAPTNISQRQAAGDEQQLTAVFNRFVKLQAIRMPLQVLTMVALAWALVAHILVAHITVR
jgi:hypothetical protein